AEPAAAPPAAWPPPSAGSQIPPPPASQEDPTLLAGMAPPSAGIGTEPVPAEPLPFIAVALADPAVPPHPEEVREPLPIAGVAPADEEPPGPKVRGVICSRGHFNDPAAPFCGVCGISMVQRTLNLVEGPRPPLGVIVFDDGTTFTLDADYVLGREPENDPSVISGDARPLALTDPDRTVSRVHAGLVLDGWSVKAVDRGSANGTFMAAPGEDSWAALTPNRPTTIKPGTRLRVGQRVFLFDSHQGTR
ncbi:MAG: FHA domain-containing protein, partial [Actinomycetota bacterium]|nr:FHA domain-containing protein [Actinomycetota bacterium]